MFNFKQFLLTMPASEVDGWYVFMLAQELEAKQLQEQQREEENQLHCFEAMAQQMWG